MCAVVEKSKVSRNSAAVERNPFSEPEECGPAYSDAQEETRVGS